MVSQGLNPEDEAGHAALLAEKNNASSYLIQERSPIGEEKKFHEVDSIQVPCLGDGQCPVCLLLHVAPQLPQAPNWAWYTLFLLEYATKEAFACRQKLWEYGFTLGDIFAPLTSLMATNRSSWWRTWLKQGYFRHGKAVERIINIEGSWGEIGMLTPQKNTPIVALHRRIADMYGYDSLGMAKLRAEGKK